jgi:hypothetical protein
MRTFVKFCIAIAALAAGLLVVPSGAAAAPFEASVVTEPAGLLLLASGLAVIAALARRHGRSSGGKK